MLQVFDSGNFRDDAGNPAGGQVAGTGIAIHWQDGPLGQGEDRKEANGAFVETVIAAVIQRIQFYNICSEGKFRCRENSLAITHLEEALHWLQARTADRTARGVEGLHEV